ncbi:MAG: undecaprenyldiphospho-muramoylpentapeptide beta-N-acetylglucosaminyltransferase [Desulfohalobiaceae bacterium]|nr:undecaprenyldiphospho-muramoylpentapeptide beta-N-acetylglucosaminyltransferase [Desulfohalobiaceae bacterium]
MKRIVLSAGGTGGHIFPALAVADELRERYPWADIVFVGGQKDLERYWAEKAGLPFVSLPAKGIMGRGIRSLGSLWWICRSLLKCSAFYRRFRPEVVVGFGSYAGFVPVWMACRQGIPAAIHEQNNKPGMTNKVLGQKVDRVFVTFPDESESFPADKVVPTGNPVRKNLLRMGEQEKRYAHEGARNILVLGGSQGAQVLNQVIVRALPSLASYSVNIMHQTGERDFEQVRTEYARQGLDDTLVRPFIDDIGAAYRWADLVICRAGASTVAELTVMGRPSILIPFPYATHAHQLDNARYLERQGAAYILEQSYLDEVNLTHMIGDLLSLPGKLKEMGSAARKLSRPDAAQRIVNSLEEMLGESGGQVNHARGDA